MKTRKKITTAVLFLVIILQVNTMMAQISNSSLSESNNYNNAIGLRAGETSGLTIKHLLNSSNAVEGILNFSQYSIGITGLYEQYVSTNIKGLRWYFGAGGHVNMGSGKTLYYPYYNDNRYYFYRYNYPGMGIGIDGIVGTEYKIPKTPLAISLDVKPFIEINSSPNVFFALDPGLGIKFTF